MRREIEFEMVIVVVVLVVVVVVVQEWNSDFGLDKDRKKDSWQGF